MIRALLLLVMMATTVRAETARVISGEHADFTRLVIELPQAGDWSVGRIPDGYAFAAKTEPQPDYDLSSVWQRIPRDRLQSLAVDPATGALSLGLGCDCHVFPFEYGSGIVVLDIREGPAPPGSAFEAAFQSNQAARPRAEGGPGYDWLDSRKSHRPKVAPTLALPLDTGRVSLQPLRDELLEQIAKGAADGVVDMALPGRPGKVDAVDQGDLPWSHIRLGEEAGVTISNPGALIPEPALTEACTSIELIDLPQWGDGRPPHELLPESRSALFGEFDAPDEAAVLQATRRLLYLGFGAEARQTIALLEPGMASEVAPLYSSLARLVDGESDPQTPFAQMLGCDGPAALWAALAHQRLPPGPDVNRDAIVQAYQALPAHLRRSLGPGLAERFLALDDAEAARMIRDAIERAPDAHPASVALLDAKADLHEGDAEAAEIHAETAVALDGSRVESLVALVEAHFQNLKPLDSEIADALLGLRNETDGTALGQDMDRAIALSLALSGQVEAAFAESASPDTTADLWQIVEARAEDDTFLRLAVLPAGDPPPTIGKTTAERISTRLLGLGFPDSALLWLGTLAQTDPPERRLTAARAELARDNAQGAVTLLAGLDGPEAEELRAVALLQLGDLPAASQALAAAGDEDAALRADLWYGDWSDLDPSAPDAWRAAAEQSRPLPLDDTGLLRRGGKAIDASLAARDAIDALLGSVPAPAD